MPGMQLVIEIDDRGSIKKVQTLGRGFGDLERRVRGGAANIAAGTAKMQRGFGGLTRTFSRMAMMGKLALAGLAIATVIVGAKFEQSMANVASVAGATSVELTELSNTARAWGSRTAFSASQAAEGMYSLASAGQKVSEIKNTIGGVLMYAGAAATSLGEAAEATVQALKMFGLAADQANRTVNVFAAGIASSMLTAERLKESLAAVGATASAMDMTLEQTVGTLGLLHNAGMLGGVAGTRLKNVLSRLAGESGKVRALLGDMAFEGDNLAEMMQHLADRGVSAGEVFGAFGRIAAPAVLTMMKAGQAEMLRMEEAVTGTQKAWEMYKTQMNTVQSQFKIFKSAIQEDMIAAFMALRPAISGSIKYLIDLAQRARPYVIGLAKTVGDFVMQNKEKAKSLVATAGKALVAVAAFIILAKTIAFLKGIFLIYWGVVQLGVGVFQTIKAAMVLFKAIMVGNWTLIHAAAIGPWALLIAAAAAVLVGIIVLMVKHRDKIKAVLGTMANAFSIAWGWVAEKTTALGVKIKDAFRKPLDWILDKIRWLAEKSGWIMDKILPGWREKLGGLIDITREKAAQIGGVIATGAEAVGKGTGEMFNWVQEKGESMLDGIKGKVDGIKNAVSGALASIKTIGGGEIGMDIAMGGQTEEEKKADDAKKKRLKEYTDEAFATIMAISDYDRAQNRRTIAYTGAHTKAWLEAKRALINDDAAYRLETETLTEEQIAQTKIEQSQLLAEAKMEHEDAILAHWIENNTLMLAGVDALGVAYDTFFDTIADREMTGQKRRELMWQSMQRSFIRSVSQMLKKWVVMELKSLLLIDAAKKKSALKEKFQDAKAGAVKAFSAFASIPIIGPILGAAAAAAAFAFLMAFHAGGKIPGRRDDMAVNAQGGEFMVRRGAVSPATQPALEYINATGRVPAVVAPGAPISLEFNISGSGTDIEALQEFIEDEIVPRIEDFQNRGGYMPGAEVVLT